ncbi:hypothetical protein SRABI133_03897 [Peribacillus simplex]|uniref:Uncharacterized protein n=1 Tax=Peribacillus simplex TaxID=1478 RepID=A0A9W4L4L8_9BACI|nr:hypothetical protein SRABI133_03897 [Peribacillus simplex]
MLNLYILISEIEDLLNCYKIQKNGLTLVKMEAYNQRKISNSKT